MISVEKIVIIEVDDEVEEFHKQIHLFELDEQVDYDEVEMVDEMETDKVEIDEMLHIIDEVEVELEVKNDVLDIDEVFDELDINE